MQKKSLKKFYPSLSPLMPQAIPQISASQGQVLPTLPPDFEKRKVDAGTSTTHECGDEKEFSQKAINARLLTSPLGRSDDGGKP
jgi:hypothetical protein